MCHTYYHVYITILKEFALDKDRLGEATIILSKMSNDFEALKERLIKSRLFAEVVEFDEKHASEFRELDFFQVNSGSVVKNMKARIRFTKLFAKLQEPFIPVDFRQYKDIYVFCDSDPIGYYLNQNRIYYHAVEDGLNCLKAYDAARYDNRGFFRVKAFMSSCNQIFIQNGYGKYCIDMEVNDISVLLYPCKKYIEVPRQTLVDRLTEEEKQVLLQVFVRDLESLRAILGKANETAKEKVLVLTEPLCDLDIRKRIFRDIIQQYGQDKIIVLKQHPRDLLDYEKEFPEYLLIEKTVPMELLNYMGEASFDQVISVFTQVDGITFAKEKVYLGADFLDQYEDPLVHRQNEQI